MGPNHEILITYDKTSSNLGFSLPVLVFIFEKPTNLTSKFHFNEATSRSSVFRNHPRRRVHLSSLKRFGGEFRHIIGWFRVSVEDPSEMSNFMIMASRCRQYAQYGHCMGTQSFALYYYYGWSTWGTALRNPPRNTRRNKAFFLKNQWFLRSNTGSSDFRVKLLAVKVCKE